jgi:hypothetical protein
MTLDMTNNRVPYGLLTDEEKAALHEHWEAGGVVEYYCEGVWFQYAPSWLYNVIYRIVPLPKTQDVIAWDRLPDWVEWVAREQGNRVYAADIEMQLYSGLWMCHSRRIRIDDFPGIVVQIGTCDWKDSKQRRPK